MERDTPSPETTVYLFVYICLSSKKRIRPTKWEKHKVPHLDGRPTYKMGAAWFLKGTVGDTAISTQCRAALGWIPSTMAWVDQSLLASVCRSNTTGYTLHTCYCLLRDPGWSRAGIHSTLKYGRGFEFVEGTYN
jgi:hypothetical protein